LLRYLKNVEFYLVGHSKTLVLNHGSRRLEIPGSWTKARLSNYLSKSNSVPQKAGAVGNLDYWVFEEKWYSSGKDLTPDEVKALLKASATRQKQTLDRAKSLASAKIGDSQNKRGQVPADLRLLIWAKYEGSCANCGATSELQFDHIIPVVMGGATSEENLQILCASCNRTKGASLS
jgi:hypothetical protein